MGETAAEINLPRVWTTAAILQIARPQRIVKGHSSLLWFTGVFHNYVQTSDRRKQKAADKVDWISPIKAHEHFLVPFDSWEQWNGNFWSSESWTSEFESYF